eukprot:m.302039 g.302039  ORF g.302039 m.302039 type:complete len:372 (+) comp15001_c0_seq1:5788-6903(+)
MLSANAWHSGISPELTELNFKRQEEFGAVTLTWRPPSVNGEYEVRLLAKCSGVFEKSDISLSQSTSAIIVGVVDTAQLELFRAEPADGIFVLGDEISFTFNKEIVCGMQPALGVAVFVDRVKTPTPLYRCEGYTIFVKPPFDFASSQGKSVTVEMTNVADKYGSVATQTFSWKFAIGARASTPSTATLRNIIVENQFPNETSISAQVYRNFAQEVPSILEEVIHQPAAAFTVVNMRLSSDFLHLFFDLVIQETSTMTAPDLAAFILNTIREAQEQDRRRADCNLLCFVSTPTLDTSSDSSTNAASTATCNDNDSRWTSTLVLQYLQLVLDILILVSLWVLIRKVLQQKRRFPLASVTPVQSSNDLVMATKA